MANKYIRHGETFNGDGTSSAAASSNGGVGAWNTITYFEGTAPAYGSLAAGDVVYIRSKDAGGANITRTLAAGVNLGSSAATAASPIHWIVDNGTVWSGVDGVVTYQNTTATAYTITQLANNKVEAKTRGGLLIQNTNAGPASHAMYVANYNVVGVKFDFAAKTGTGNLTIQLLSAAAENCLFTLGRLSTVATSAICGSTAADSIPKLINCDIELTSTIASTQPVVGAGSGSLRSDFEIVGGSVFGVGMTGQAIIGVGAAGTLIRAIGFEIPKAATPVQTITNNHIRVELFGLDGGSGCHLERAWGFVTTRSDTNHPVLSARLPDSAQTPWSYRIYPRGPSVLVPISLPITKVFDATAATKTVTLEYLLSDEGMASTTENTWMTVSYIDDTTGAMRTVSTQVDRTNAAATATSTAAWSSTGWGLVSFVKRKLSVTTPTAIKQDTLVTVVFNTTAVASTANDIMFLDPDFSLT